MESACLIDFGLCVSRDIDLGLFLTIALFLAGIVINSQVDRNKRGEEARKRDDQRREARRTYLRALSEEIKLNVESLKTADRGLPSVCDINAFMAANPQNRPFITFSYLSVIYNAHTEVLQDLPDILVRNIVEFYGKLTDIGIDIAAIDKDAFARISQRGREETIYEFVSGVKVALQQGTLLSDSIELQLRPERSL